MMFGMLLAVPAIAFADNFQNTLAASETGTRTVTTDGTTPGTTTVGYRVIGTGGDLGPSGPGTGNCNASDGTPLGVSFNVSGVTATPSTLSFTSCGTTQNVTFSSTQPGTYTIDPGLSDTGAGTYADQAPFTLVVNDNCPSGDTSGNLQDGKCTSNTPPVVSVSGVTDPTYEFGSEPTATCNVTDTEDANESATPVIDRSALNNYGLGTVTVKCSYTDAGNLSDSDEVSYTIVDTTKPNIAAHGDVSAEATGPNGAEVTYTAPTANDAVYGNLGDANCTPVSGSQFGFGDTTVTCTATDGSDNTATSTFKVTVADTTAPAIAAHADVNATATSANGATVNYTSPGTTDAVDGPGTANCTPASGTTFAVGSTTVTCTATDGHNNTATSTFKVNVAYSWSNFLQPINVTGTQSVFKLGSTVPVKFNLTGASAGITDGTFYLKYFYLGAGDGLGEQEAVATTTGTTGTEFRYSAGQYIYNWSTKSVSKPGNYELRVYSDSAGTVLLGKVAIEIKK